jgi:hypothetical protein
MKMYELLADPAHWTKGHYASDVYGVHVGFDDPRATCWCTIGAAYKCYGVKDALGAHGILDKIVDKLLDTGNNSIAGWNDLPNTTHGEVITLLKELDV